MTDIYLYPVPSDPNAADIRLRNPLVADTQATWDARPPARSLWRLRQELLQEVEAESLYRNLIRYYGLSEGPRIYELMKLEEKGPFAPGKKYGRKLDG